MSSTGVSAKGAPCGHYRRQTDEYVPFENENGLILRADDHHLFSGKKNSDCIMASTFSQGGASWKISPCRIIPMGPARSEPADVISPSINVSCAFKKDVIEKGFECGESAIGTNRILNRQNILPRADHPFVVKQRRYLIARQ